MVRTKDPGGSALERLRQFGLRYPGAHTKSPWPGHLDLAVNDKTFAYLSIAGEPLTISCKLPRSADAALELPFTTPAAYGLGKSGWVTATFPDDAGVPVDLLEEWIDESYRAQAPKRLSAGLPPFGASASIEPGAAEELPQAGAASSSARRAPRRSTVKRGSAAAAGSKPRATQAKPSKRAATPRAAKAKATARGASRREPARAAERAPRAKRQSVNPQAARRPAKKRARPPS